MAVEYLTQTGALLMNGPTGIMVSLGIERAPEMSLAAVYMYYNYISVCLIFLFSAMAGARSESRFLVSIPIIGGILTWWGWIHAPNQAQFVAFLVITFILGIFSYMNDMNREKYGISGPGSKMLNIVMFLIIFQAAVGCINSFSLFGDNMMEQPTPNACTVGYACDQYGNINLEESVTSVKSSGGLFESIVSLSYALPAMGLMLLKLLVNIITSVLFFAPVLNATISGIYPGIISNVAYVAFLALMQVGIWAIYTMTIFSWFYRPTPGEGTI